MAEFEMRTGWWKTRSGKKVLIYRRRPGSQSAYPWDGAWLTENAEGDREPLRFTKVYCWNMMGLPEAVCHDQDPMDLMQFVEPLFIPDFPPSDVIDGPGIYEDDNDGSEWKIIGRTADTELWIGVCGTQAVGLFYSSGEFLRYTVSSQCLSLPKSSLVKKIFSIDFQDVEQGDE